MAFFFSSSPSFFAVMREGKQGQQKKASSFAVRARAVLLLGTHSLNRQRSAAKGSLPLCFTPFRLSNLSGLNTLCSMPVQLVEREWDEWFEKLKRFKEQFGNSRVPPDWPSDPGLAKWTAKQRNEFHRLALEKIEMLVRFGFD